MKKPVRPTTGMEQKPFTNKEFMKFFKKKPRQKNAKQIFLQKKQKCPIAELKIIILSPIFLQIKTIVLNTKLFRINKMTLSTKVCKILFFYLQ